MSEQEQDRWKTVTAEVQRLRQMSDQEQERWNIVTAEVQRLRDVDEQNKKLRKKLAQLEQQLRLQEKPFGELLAASSLGEPDVEEAVAATPPAVAQGIVERAAALQQREAEFRTELSALLNRYSRENASNTPDYILAAYLVACLEAFDTATNLRGHWYEGEY